MLDNLGCESQFTKKYQFGKMIDWMRDATYETKDSKPVTAFHWSDICLPENSRRIWNDPVGMAGVFSSNVMAELFATEMNLPPMKNWQSFLKPEVEKALKK